eukprot:347529-Chlamydomonas_euryale.AAC.1
MNVGRRWPEVEFTVPSTTPGGMPRRMIVVVKPRKFDSMDQRTAEVIASRMQVPLARAWALTVHKSQGLTAEGATVRLGNVFSYGQVYTAASRVGRFSQLRFEIPKENSWMLASRQ